MNKTEYMYTSEMAYKKQRIFPIQKRNKNKQTLKKSSIYEKTPEMTQGN